MVPGVSFCVGESQDGVCHLHWIVPHLIAGGIEEVGFAARVFAERPQVIVERIPNPLARLGHQIRDAHAHAVHCGQR